MESTYWYVCGGIGGAQNSSSAWVECSVSSVLPWLLGGSVAYGGSTVSEIDEMLCKQS